MVATAAAIVLPTLVVPWAVVGYAVFAQIVAVLFWGRALALWGVADRQGRAPWRDLAPLTAVVMLLVLGICGTWLRVEAAAPGPAVCALGLLLAALLTAASAARLGTGPHADAAAASLVAGLLIAAGVGSVIGLLQVAVPDYPDGLWVGRWPDHTRAAGNLLQPNLLATLCAMALAGSVSGQHAGWLGRPGWWLVTMLMPASVGLTASRAGLLQLGLLAAWALLDRSLPRQVRWGLVMAPFVCVGVILAAQALLGDPPTSAMSRESLRLDVFRGAWALIAEQPWLGVGWDELGTAWALSPAVNPLGYPTDHAHNLPLHLAAELGLPLAVAAVSGLVWSLLMAWKRCQGSPRTGLLMLLLAVTAHSLAEFPLWFAFFLLPTAWALGLALVGPPAPPGMRRLAAPVWVPAGLAVAVAAFLCLGDFARVLPATLPLHHSTPLAQRLQQAQASWLFAHHAAGVAAATLPAPPLQTFVLARHTTIDRCLLVAWSTALARNQRLNEARHVAQRVQLYPGWSPSPWLEACQRRGFDQLPAGRPEQPLDWRQLRR